MQGHVQEVQPVVQNLPILADFNLWDFCRAICNSSTLISRHCCSCMFALSACIFFIHSTFSLKSFSSLHIVSQNLSMSFIAGVSFTVTFSFPVSLQNLLASFLKIFHVSRFFAFFGLYVTFCFTVLFTLVIFSQFELYFLFNFLHIFLSHLCRLRHMRHVITCTCLCTCLKHKRGAKKACLV